MTIMNASSDSVTKQRTSHMTPSSISFIFLTPFFLVWCFVVRPASQYSYHRVSYAAPQNTIRSSHLLILLLPQSIKRGKVAYNKSSYEIKWLLDTVSTKLLDFFVNPLVDKMHGEVLKKFQFLGI